MVAPEPARVRPFEPVHLASAFPEREPWRADHRHGARPLRRAHLEAQAGREIVLQIVERGSLGPGGEGQSRGMRRTARTNIKALRARSADDNARTGDPPHVSCTLGDRFGGSTRLIRVRSRARWSAAEQEDLTPFAHQRRGALAGADPVAHHRGGGERDRWLSQPDVAGLVDPVLVKQGGALALLLGRHLLADRLKGVQRRADCAPASRSGAPSPPDTGKPPSASQPSSALPPHSSGSSDSKP